MWQACRFCGEDRADLGWGTRGGRVLRSFADVRVCGVVEAAEVLAELSRCQHEDRYWAALGEVDRCLGRRGI